MGPTRGVAHMANQAAWTWLPDSILSIQGAGRNLQMVFLLGGVILHYQKRSAR